MVKFDVILRHGMKFRTTNKFHSNILYKIEFCTVDKNIVYVTWEKNTTDYGLVEYPIETVLTNFNRGAWVVDKKSERKAKLDELKRR